MRFSITVIDTLSVASDQSSVGGSLERTRRNVLGGADEAAVHAPTPIDRHAASSRQVDPTVNPPSTP